MEALWTAADIGKSKEERRVFVNGINDSLLVHKFNKIFLAQKREGVDYKRVTTTATGGIGGFLSMNGCVIPFSERVKSH